MARVPGWYATSVLRPDDMNNPTWQDRLDAAIIHAKKAGTTFTACGRDASTWHKHWMPFDGGRTRNACRDCIDALVRIGAESQ